MSTKTSDRAVRPPAEEEEIDFLARRNEEQDHWKHKLESDDFRKMGVADFDEFLRLCELRRRPVPQVFRNNYRWLHHYRAEFLKRWSHEDNRKCLDASKPKQSTPPTRKKGQAQQPSRTAADEAALMAKARSTSSEGRAEDIPESSRCEMVRVVEKLAETLERTVECHFWVETPTGSTELEGIVTLDSFRKGKYRRL